MDEQVERSVTTVAPARDPDYLPYSTEPVVDDRPSDEVITELFHREYAGLLRLAYCITGERCSAEDAVMEAFCSLHVHWSQMRKASAPLPYLRSAVILGSRSVLRQVQRARRRPPLFEVGRPDPSGEDGVAGAVSGTLADAVRALPTRQREVVVCRYYLELSEAETAATLGISVGTVKRHAYRARETLATHLRNER